MLLPIYTKVEQSNTVIPGFNGDKQEWENEKNWGVIIMNCQL
jgi:hypothetical protein